MPEKYKAEYKKKLDQTRVELADQVKSAVTEFENVTPTNDQLTDLQEAHFVVFESEENSESVMDGFVEHPFYTATLNGQKYVVMKTKDDSYWKDLIVEGKRVTTVSKDPKIILERLFSHMYLTKQFTMRLLKSLWQTLVMKVNIMSEL